MNFIRQAPPATYKGFICPLHPEISLFSVSQCLLSFCGYSAWVTFERRDLKGIQIEIGRLFRSDTFNPALRTESEECDEKQKDQESCQNEGQSEVMSPRQAVENDRSAGAIYSILVKIV